MAINYEVATEVGKKKRNYSFERKISFEALSWSEGLFGPEHKGVNISAPLRKVLRVCSKITSGFYKHLLHTCFVKNTHRSPAMIAFFALPVHKIASLNSRTYFCANPMLGIRFHYIF